MSGFFTLHRDLHREGPGEPADVDWALSRITLPAAPRICDAGCGPGADLETFADRLPDARLEGIDGVDHFVTEAQARVPGAQVRKGDMAQITGPYDLIWCAGALYFLGVTEGLRGWRDALAPGGWIAFSEPAAVPGAPPEAQAFWAEYPALTDREGVIARIDAADYRVEAVRRIIGAPWEAYYTPMQARIAALRPSADAELTEALDENQREIDLWRAARDFIAYDLFLVQPR